MYAVSEKRKRKKVESLYAKCKVCFFVWLLRNSGKNQRNFGFSFFFFFFFFFFVFCILYFGLCIEFQIELLKKIEALLFFEIELVCGIGLCFWVCLYLLRIQF